MNKPTVIQKPRKRKRIFFTADEHYGHRNVLIYSQRPFKSIQEMNETLIENHNQVVTNNDLVIHAGDFTLNNKSYAEKIIKQLNGNHVFLRGSHDYWLKKSDKMIHEMKIGSTFIVICHYAMRTWARSHYNSIMLYGHSHGRLEPIGKQWDIGVDNNNYYPVSYEEIKKIMDRRPDNPNFLGYTKRKKNG